jgi:hypothetical protein
MDSHRRSQRPRSRLLVRVCVRDHSRTAAHSTTECERAAARRGECAHVQLLGVTRSFILQLLRANIAPLYEALRDKSAPTPAGVCSCVSSSYVICRV